MCSRSIAGFRIRMRESISSQYGQNQLHRLRRCCSVTSLDYLLGISRPLIQAPMAGVQDSALAVAVSNVGALGSLPCAMLSPDALRTRLSALASTGRPYNV